MTRIHRRLGGFMVLAITAVVSVFAGGILLGGASAEEPAGTKPTLMTLRTEATVGADDVEGTMGCVIVVGEGLSQEAREALRLERLPENVLPSFEMRKVDGVTMAGSPPPSIAFSAGEGRPLSAEEVQRLEDEGVLREVKKFSPEDCKVISPNGEFTPASLPEASGS